jgi:hypothetical protein
MGNASKGKMVWGRKNIDPVLKAVLAEIHKTAQPADKGFYMTSYWCKRWNLTDAQTLTYIRKAIETGILEKRMFRVITHGRLQMMAHYGPPDKPKRKAS